MKTCINIPFTYTPVRFMEVAGCTSRDTQIPMLAWCRWSGFLYSNMVKKKHFNLTFVTAGKLCAAPTHLHLLPGAPLKLQQRGGGECSFQAAA